MFTSGTIPPIGVNESCIEFTAPHDAAVVITANRGRVRNPETCLLALKVSADNCLIDRLGKIGLPAASAEYAIKTPARNNTDIAPNTAHPCPCEPIIIPSMYVSPAGIRKISSI